MNINKRSALIAVVALALSLSACSNEVTKEAAKPTTVETTVAPAPEQNKEPESEPTTAEPEIEVPSVEDAAENLYKAMVNGDPVGYDLFSPACQAKQGDRDSFTWFKSVFADAGITAEQVVVESAEVTGNTATVKGGIGEVEVTHWELIDGQWRYLGTANALC